MPGTETLLQGKTFMRQMRIARGWGLLVMVVLLGCSAALAQVGGIAPKFLVDVTAADADKQLKATDDGQCSFTVGKEGITLSIKGGAASYPGVTITSPTGAPWDLSPWGHIEAKITNLGADRLSMGMRVDNAGDWKQQPWCAEVMSLKPGESKVIKVIFGYSYGFKPSFKLNPGAVTQVMFIANNKSDKERSFRIEDFQASGSAGEKPPVDPNTLRIKPEQGMILGVGSKIDAVKQLAAKNVAKAKLVEGNAIQVDFTGGKKDEQVTLQPMLGSWQLTDYFQVQVKIKNIGQTAVTPRARVESKSGTTDTIAAATAIAPNGTGEITIPFAAVVSAVIPTDPRQEKFGPGSWNEQNWSPEKGTGTTFSSGWVKGVTLLSDQSDGAKSLLITSITASVPVAKLPDWLGKRPPVEGDWVKTFDEEFDKDKLDLNTWNIYTDNFWDKRTHFSKDNTYIKDGKLVLHYEKKTGFQNDNPEEKRTVGQTDYACGFADTYGKWVQRYGYFEARVKLPKAPGLWPAFWTMPDRGVATGPQWKRASTGQGGMELDILEYLSGWGPFRYNMAYHWDGYGKEHKAAGTPYNYVLPDKDGYITAGAYWVPGLIVYYAQGKEVMRWQSPRVCNLPSYVMFNMVSGGWDNEPLDDAKLPDDFMIDYVRVWQRKDLASPVDGPKPNKGLPSSLD